MTNATRSQEKIGRAKRSDTYKKIIFKGIFIVILFVAYLGNRKYYTNTSTPKTCLRSDAPVLYTDGRTRKTVQLVFLPAELLYLKLLAALVLLKPFKLANQIDIDWTKSSRCPKKATRQTSNEQFLETLS